eukprot:15709-Heterococcus_DN1.PRE.3
MPDEPAKLVKSAELVGVEPGQSFAEGQAIRANYHGKGQYFAGQIAKVHANGTFDIAYDDGDSETQVAIENLKPLRAKHTPAQTVDDSKGKSDKAEAVLTAPSTPAASSIDAVQPTPARRNSAVSEKAVVASPQATGVAVAIAAPQKLAVAPTTTSTAAQATAVQSSSNNSSSTSSWAHAIGDRVEAKSHGQWHSGTVVTRCAGSCYGITYDTGEKEINVPEKRLRLPVQR